MRGLLVVSGICCLGGLAGVANGYRVEEAAQAAQRDAVDRGMLVSATVDGSLPSKQRRTRVGLVVAGIEREVSVFANRPYTRGTVVEVAYLPTGPDRVYIVGAKPWTWWAAMRPLFAAVALAGGILLTASLLRQLRT